MTSQKEEQQSSVAAIVAKFSASKIYRQVTGIATAYLRPKLLGPEDYGLWQLLRILPNYSAYMHLGAQTSMRYNVPKHLGKDELQQAEALQSNALGMTMLLNSAIALIMILVGLFGGFNFKITTGIFAIALSVVILAFYNYQMSVLKAHEQFRILTKSNYVQVTCLSTLTVIGLLLGGIYGLYVSFPLAHVIAILYNHRLYRTPMSVSLDRVLLKGMLRFGFPMMLMSIAIMLVNTTDRIMVASLLGNKELGYYGISAMFMGFLMNVPGAAREVLEPRLMRELGSRPLRELADDYLFNPLKNTAYLMPILIGAIVFGLPVVIPFILPNYVKGVFPTQILTVGSYFFAHVIVVRGMIAARELQNRAWRLVLVALAVNIGGSILAVHWGYDLPGIAVASTLAYLVLYVVLYMLVVNDLKLAGRGFAKLLSLGLPFPIMLGLFWASSFWPTPLGLDGMIHAGIKVVVFVILMWGLRMLFGRVPKKAKD